MTRLGLRAALPLLCAALAPAAGPVDAQEIRLSGQVRPRFEFREPAPPLDRDDFVSMRTRLGLAASLPDNVAVTLQVQDVRYWGEDRSAITAPGVTELHQAFLDVSRINDRGIAARVGRQELLFGAERLIGNADWAPRARAFDGVRATLGTTDAGTLDLFATRLADRSAAQNADAAFHGAYAILPIADGVAADLYGLYNRVRPVRTDQATAGFRVFATRTSWSAEAETAFQFGRRTGGDVSAWMLRATAGPTWVDGRARTLLSFEHYSGSTPGDADIRVFDALFGTAHRFLGFADLFTSIPAHTAGRGIQDFALRTTLAPDPALQLIINLHSLRAASSAGLSSNRFADEVDLRAAWRWRSPLHLTGGFSWVRHGPALREIGRLDRDMSWAYLMLNAAF
jgi:hypothetical protein